MAEDRSLCPGGCGQHIEEAHDPKTARTWQVNTTVCEACRVMQAQMHNDREAGGARGVLYGVRRNGG